MPFMSLTEQGRSAPVVVCDHCGERIGRASEGNYEWESGVYEEGHLTQIYFLHKQCSRAFEERMGKRMAQTELQYFFKRATVNAEVDEAAVEVMLNDLSGMP
jgi:hypothetical protein